jgi:hypothetical protein
MDRLDFFEVNRPKYPRFDDSTRLAAKNEIYETFAHLLKGNAPLGDLLKADYVVINRLLADYYSIPGVEGDAFRKVALPTGSPRGGLLGMAAVSFMGGNGDHTSPVERGAWVLRKLLHDPPPPAPANVPQIARLAGKVLTTRERLFAHQEEAQCASCHRKIDPIGFGLENFDAIGRWREKDESGGKVDAAGELPGGKRFSSPKELKAIIAARGNDLSRNLTEKLLAYALCRQLDGYDLIVVDQMQKTIASDGLKMQTLISEVVTSYPFLNRRVRD